MKQYVKGNITHEAASSVKYFVKILSEGSEIMVFMFLGLTTMSDSAHNWDTAFVIVTVLGCLVFRFIGKLMGYKK